MLRIPKMSSAVLDRASTGRAAYVPITTRHRVVTVSLVAALYVIAIIIALLLPDRPPLRQVRTEALVVALLPLRPPLPPPPVPVPPPPTIPRVAPTVAVTQPRRPAVQMNASAPTPAPAPDRGPPTIPHFDFTPVPAAPPAALPQAGGGGATRPGGSGTGGTGNGGGGGMTAIKAEWAKPVSWEEVLAFHPARARGVKMSGKAVLRCQVTLKRKLKACLVESETPAGWAFGSAALGMARTLRVLPRKVNGNEIDAGWVFFTIAFDFRPAKDAK